MNLKYHHWALILLALIVAALPFSHSSAQTGSATAQAGETVSYRFRSGDTLLALASKYFRQQTDYLQVQRLNNISDPRRIRVGTVLKIPYKILKFSKESANVIAYRGPVRIAGANIGPQPREPVLNEAIEEGSGLATGADASLSLSTSDGSIITMPSNSVMRITKLRRILLNDSIDIEYALDEGGVRTKVQPARKAEDRYRVRTPSAVSAVRGTDFRNRFDPVSNKSFAELLEGGLQVATNDNGDTALLPGFGAAISDQGLKTEALLSPPVILSGQGVQREEDIVFAVAPVEGAQRYRLVVAKDSGFINVVAEAENDAPKVIVSNLDNGNYFAKVTAFSKTGLEGLPTKQAFRRRLNNVSAKAAQEDDGFAFRWTSSGSERKLYRFQLFTTKDVDAEDFSTGEGPPLVDEAALTQTKVSVSSLPAGKYYWRVGTYLYGNGEIDAAWTDFESFTIAAD